MTSVLEVAAAFEVFVAKQPHYSGRDEQGIRRRRQKSSQKEEPLDWPITLLNQVGRYTTVSKHTLS